MKRRYLVWRRVRYPYLIFRTRWSVEPIYSMPDGGLCLKSDANWRNWSGFAFRCGRLIVWAYFRRGAQV